ncbi:transcription factor Adf-1 [Elysia marginata]|uniref:Transcription factor Adf-1 n=1 Tax=Elysia marginata TaxID=1093978 RepID=A0AAV4JDG2_9GAST|nr:transcription factor Adf-1 [Elysia marginata]
MFFFSEAALKNKWKSLRDYFSAEYGKRPVARSGDGASSHPKSRWQYFQQLLFLKDIVTPRASFDSLELDAPGVIEDSPIAPTQQDHDDSGEFESQSTSSISRPQEGIEEFEYTEPGPSRDSPGSTKRTKIQPTKEGPFQKRKKDNPSYREILDIEAKKLELLREREQKNEMTNDADFLFLKSLHPYLQMVPQHLKLAVGNRLQSVLEDFVYPPATSHRSPPQQYTHMAHSQQPQERATPTPSYQSYSTTSTPHSFTSYTTEYDSHNYQ